VKEAEKHDMKTGGGSNDGKCADEDSVITMIGFGNVNATAVGTSIGAAPMQ